MVLFRLLLVTLALATAGCAVEIPPPLDAQERATYKVSKVEVVVSDTASIRWGSGEELVLADAGLSDATDDEKNAFLSDSEGQTALRTKAQNILQAAVDSKVRGTLTGTKPMQVSVVVDDALTSSPGRVFLVGGLQAAGGGAQLFDLETGEAVTKPQRLIGIENGGGGIIGAIVESASRDPMIRIGERLGETIVRWITATEPIALGTDEDYNRQPLPPLPKPEIATSANG